jgi:hypothetical protein
MSNVIKFPDRKELKAIDFCSVIFNEDVVDESVLMLAMQEIIYSLCKVAEEGLIVHNDFQDLTDILLANDFGGGLPKGELDKYLCDEKTALERRWEIE